MSDGTVIANPGSGGAAFGVDIDTGPSPNVAYPYSKVMFGASGTRTEVADVAGQRLPVKNIGPRGSLNDFSGVITSPATGAQVILPANPNRNYLVVRNPQASGQIFWINFGSNATQDFHSWELQQGEFFFQDGSGFVLTDEITIFGPIGAQYLCKEG